MHQRVSKVLETSTVAIWTWTKPAIDESSNRPAETAVEAFVAHLRQAKRIVSATLPLEFYRQRFRYFIPMSRLMLEEKRSKFLGLRRRPEMAGQEESWKAYPKTISIRAVRMRAKQ